MRLIDANKLRKDIEDLPNCYNGFSDTYDKACIIGVIDDQPAVDPVTDVLEVRHGKWVDVEGYEGILYRCSACEDKRYKHTTIKYDYCPDCGAKMDAEEGEEA